MKILYASLAVAAIALSGCSDAQLADFFGYKSNAELERQARYEADVRFLNQILRKRDEECILANKINGYMIACSSHNDKEHESVGRDDISDRRLKRDLLRVGTLPNGIPLYSFNYIWGGSRYIGVVAQDVLKIVPAAVIVDQYGFYRVDYSMIGARMVLADDQPPALFANSSALREQRNMASH